jgi:hypothetical protein
VTMRKTVGVVALACGMLGGHAHAADFGIYGTAGTVGLGGGIAASFNKYLGARIGYASYEYTVDDLEESDLLLDGTLDLGGAQAFLDWHPFGGGFRITAGAVENGELYAHAKPIGGTYTINDVEYTADQIGEATGTAKFDSISPYLGIGFGHPLSVDGRFAFTADFGVVFTGSPKVELTATCGAAVNTTVCAQIQSDVRAEQVNLQEDADDLKYWPVISIGLSFKF